MLDYEGRVRAVNKPRGLTPLQVLRSLSPTMKRSYAGRLDPLAHGVLIVLEGKHTLKQEEYQHHDKTYIFEYILGIHTDSYDLLGMVCPIDGVDKGIDGDGDVCYLSTGQKEGEFTPDLVLHYEDRGEWDRKVRVYEEKAIGDKIQTTPPYASTRIQGKALFWWARENRLREVADRIPRHKVHIYALDRLGGYEVSREEFERCLWARIAGVKGNGFRQDEIKQRWEQVLRGMDERGIKQIPIVRMRAKVSSGTYIRGLVCEWGRELGCGAMAWDIYRTQCGEHHIDGVERVRGVEGYDAEMEVKQVVFMAD